MKKTPYSIWLGLFILTVLMGCKNNEVSIDPDKHDISEKSFSTSDAKNWFQESVIKGSQNKSRQPRFLNKSLVWKYAVSRYPKKIGQTLIIPIKYEGDTPVVSLNDSSSNKQAPSQDINFSARLVIWKNKEGAFQYQVHQVIPDNKYIKKNGNKINNDLSGIVLITDIDGNFIEGYRYDNGIKTGKLDSGLKSGRTSTCTVYIIDWYTRVCIDNDCFEPRWTHAEEYIVCYESDHGSDGITPPPTVSSPQTVTNNYDSHGQYVYQIDSPGPQLDIREYLKCFGINSNSNSIFRVVIYVDQVLPGYRSFNLNSSNSSPGHVYVGLEEYSNGQATVRHLGFYPNDLVNPITPSSDGHAQEDDRAYDVSLTIEVEWGQFLGIVSSLEGAAGAEYNLNSNNCTHYALNACSDNGISLPRTIGTWWGGSGLNPSDLAEDIRSMTLPSNMTRNVTGGYPLAIQGSCP